ncbi:MAG: 2,3-diphosphoglycerate-dependent phosphoglycerate mutase [archaeon]|nr:2,3-diphosphoglycerate-dependent phosphoglycerate mutase [archaeon]
MKLVLVRHGESIWNRDNLFTGWTDVGLSDIGKKEAIEVGKMLKIKSYDFDICYTSYLKRAIQTLNYILYEMDREWLPVVKTWKLNERHYGALQGLNKSEVAKKFGLEQVMLWRRSYAIKPPALNEDDARNPILQDMYREEDKNELPLTECLADTFDRVIPYYNSEIIPKIMDGKRVLIVSHGNSLRALMKYIENISDTDIIDVNVPTGIPLIYEFDSNLKIIGKEILHRNVEPSFP